MEVYIDDMLVNSLEAEDHISHLQQGFSALRKYTMKLNPAKCSFGVSSGKFLGYIVTHRGIEANPEQIRVIHSIPCPKNVKEVQNLTGRMAALRRFISRLSDKSHAFFGALKNPRNFQWTKECESALQELVLHKPEVSGRLAKWAVELGEYDVIFRPATAIKSPVLADFVAEFSSALLPALEQEVRLRGETKEEVEWILHVDGSNNVRGAGMGIVLTSPTGNTASRTVRCNFKATNNESEYEALIAGLTLVHQMGAKNIQGFDDFQLIINQNFKSCKLTQIPREQNSQADALANLWSALEANSQMSTPLLVLQLPATLEEPPSEEVSAVEEGETWMTPLVRYLEADILPEDRNKARKIKKQAARYCISQEKLYRRSFSGPYLMCVTPREAARILVELYEGDCGTNSSGKSLVLRARKAGYYLPTMAADADKQAKHCDKCQRHSPVSKLPPKNLKSISSPWPFRKWGMDIVGKFPMAPGQKVFRLIVTDYFSKWVKVEALSSITNLHIYKFLWTYVITLFGVPRIDNRYREPRHIP
ncbi:uncharacterized protein LOC125604234 [Brassica napus]|uniref:uncharacterized protein LOC125589024 n=1 Tax=Brassica napus TaxID=3708 RepID=UPI002078D92E|nr:uncharacterized protein LOC125589024 [Brassica napus]XP_048630670.1 uncharacterized protein LOC125604234 [Brassica napus]